MYHECMDNEKNMDFSLIKISHKVGKKYYHQAFSIHLLIFRLNCRMYILLHFFHFCYFFIQSRSIVSVEPSSGYLFSARWSPIRPLVFAVVTGNGQLLIYDLKSSKVTPVQSLQASPNKQAVYTLQFNTNQ